VKPPHKKLPPPPLSLSPWEGTGTQGEPSKKKTGLKKMMVNFINVKKILAVINATYAVAAEKNQAYRLILYCKIFLHLQKCNGGGGHSPLPHF